MPVSLDTWIKILFKKNEIIEWDSYFSLRVLFIYKDCDVHSLLYKLLILKCVILSKNIVVKFYN